MSSSDTVYSYRKRRNVELFLVIVAQLISLAGFLVTYWNIQEPFPQFWSLLAGAWLTLGVVAHLAVRFLLPYADPVLLPCALLLNGLGLVTINRLDLASREGYNHAAQQQLMWTVLSLIAFIVVLALVRDHRPLGRFPYLLFILGLVLLLLPLVPGVGQEKFGARIWIHFGPLSFQPAEIAKIVLALAFAGYLVEKRDVLSLSGRHLFGIDFPRARDLGPILIMWVVAVSVLVFETDLGTSLLFFGLFVSMLYIATERPSWPILGSVLFVAAALFAWRTFGHVQRRVDAWLYPFEDYDHNLQIIQAQFGIDWGGISGTGLGLGSAWRVPLAKSDMIFTSLGEELGLVGMFAVLMIYSIIIARGLRTALISREPFGKLLVSGLSFAFALQVFAIIGGVTRLIPLTGLTTPFMSQGGTSLVANWVLIALLLIVSHYARRPVTVQQALVTTPEDNQQTQLVPTVPSTASLPSFSEQNHQTQVISR
ncbi:MAG: FtsW/RodA/SpoVE family cell cycle protein [Propionibacteriaceae bacterium]